MRTVHSIVAFVVLASAVVAVQAPAPAAGQTSDFTVFFRGRAVGSEQTTVTRTAEGHVVSGTSRLTPPFSASVRRAEIRYTSDWRLVDCTIEGAVRDQLLVLRTHLKGTTARTDMTQGTATSQKTDEIAADAIILPNVFFGANEALAARLISASIGSEIKAYLVPDAQVTVKVIGVEDDRVRTAAGAFAVRRFALQFQLPDQTMEAQLWAESSGRLVRFSMPSQSIDILRTDVASVAARLERSTRPNDQEVQIPADGFSLAATLSRPTEPTPPKTRLPIVILVGGTGPVDRDETTAEIPIFGQLASVLADTGFLVIRYDRRGVGQSGGRAETATLSDYADDVCAAVRYARKRKDVDSRRIALLGHGEGGYIAMLAASREGAVSALVLAATPGVSGAAHMLDQQQKALSRLALTDAEKQARIELQQKILHVVMTGKGIERLPAEIRRQADTPWFQSLLLFDPARIIRKIDRPILIVQGEVDRQVQADNAEKLAALARARKGAAGRAVKLLMFPGINHLLVPATTGELDEYARLTDKKVSSGIPTAICGWLKDNMGKR